MILVLGSVVAKAESLAQALELSQAHVARSRAEPGCIAHGVHQDAEQPLRLVFVEQWADRAALQAHFALPESRAFAKALAALASAPPSMNLFDAQPIKM